MQLGHGVCKTNTDLVNILSNLSEKLFSAWVYFLFVLSFTDIQIYCLFQMSLRFPFFFLSSCKMLPYPLHAWAYAVKLLWEKSALRSHCGTLMTSKQDDSYYFLWLCFIWGANPQHRAYRLQITVVWAEKKGLCQDLNSHDELFYPRKGKRRGIQPTQNEHLPKTLTCGIIRFQLAQRPGVLDVA